MGACPCARGAAVVEAAQWLRAASSMICRCAGKLCEQIWAAGEWQGGWRPRAVGRAGRLAARGQLVWVV